MSAVVRSTRASGVMLEPAADLECPEQAPGHGLSVEDVRVAGRGLDAVGDRVAEVELDPNSPLALVRGHDLDLRPGAALDELRQGPRLDRRARPRRQGRPFSLEEREDALVAEERVLDALAQRCPSLTRGQRRQERDVEHDGRRLVEGADEVLALGQVQAGLAADRGVDLGEQRRRQLDEWHAAQPGRGQEAGRVAQRAAATGDDRLAAFHAARGELTERRLVRTDRLCPLAARQEEGHDLDRPRRRDRLRQAQPMAPPGLGLAGQRGSTRTDPLQGVGRGPSAVAVPDVEAPDRGRGGEEAGPLGRGPCQGIGEAAGDVLGAAAALDRFGGIVEAGARGEQLAERGLWLPAGDERSHRATRGQATGHDLGCCREGERSTATVQIPAVARVDDRPATGRHDAGRPGCWIGASEALDRGALPGPEAGLALGFEDAGHARSGRLLDDLVEVDEGGPARPGQAPPDGALAAPRRADEHDVHDVLSRPRRSRTRPRPAPTPLGRRPWPASAPRGGPGCRAPPGANRRRTSRARSGSGSGAPSPLR